MQGKPGENHGKTPSHYRQPTAGPQQKWFIIILIGVEVDKSDLISVSSISLSKMINEMHFDEYQLFSYSWPRCCLIWVFSPFIYKTICYWLTEGGKQVHAVCFNVCVSWESVQFSELWDSSLKEFPWFLAFSIRHASKKKEKKDWYHFLFPFISIESRSSPCRYLLALCSW